ncbi:MAG: type II toxin-antitoxin system Phd/YefM family antitoxin [Verrucomicrobia bacterium]|jgi:prevent-host-death family protein|nr:type II toxin-antitoxin system Phd/YefM family antitoxin [Verrucomicrobiota bacterium]MDA1065261.1 type II toxin-antitoxin system Phd/YefM family antitoxin [Verrucomicrobiota bacterium]
MKTILISEFKARCIAILKEAQRTREPVLVTRRGHPLARIEPVYDNPPPRKFGALKSRMRIKGDIVHSDFDSEWESSI